jgi:hypothetical protein
LAPTAAAAAVKLSVVRDDDTRRLRRRERAAKLIDRAADLTAATSGGVGALIAGPPGALAGTGVGLAIREVLLRLGDEFEQRQLGPREKQRAGAALYWALKDVKERLDDEQEPRTDGFFAPDDLGGRGRADELLEAVLTRAMGEHEERKVRHLGYLYAALVFREDIKPGHGNFLVDIASRLTWEQLVLIALIHEKGYRGLPDWPAFNPFSIQAHGVAGQLFDLARQGIVVRTDSRPVDDISRINPSYLQTATTGCLLLELMRLNELDSETLAEAFDQVHAVANEPPSFQLLSRLASAVDAERVTAEDLDTGRIRVRLTDDTGELLPAPGSTVQANLRGVALTWTVQATEDPALMALVPGRESREEFFAVIDEGSVVRVSKGHSGELWLD